MRVAAILCVLVATLGARLPAGEIHDAVAAGDVSRVRALLEADPALLQSKDDVGNTPLHTACIGIPPTVARQVAVANFLLDKGANAGASNNGGDTPLLFATRNLGPDFDLVQRLIAKGADVNPQPGSGMTPLHWVAISGDTKAARFLIDHGASLNAYNDVYGTVLHTAINAGRDEEMAELLVEHGAKINRRLSFGNAELHLAAMKGYAGLVRLLVEHGADVHATNEDNRTALYYAAKLGYRRTVDALLAGGAKEDEILERNYGGASQLVETLQEGEAYLWYLLGLTGNGYAVKTKGHLLLFDPSGIDASPEAGVANGNLNPSELAGQDVTVLITKRAGLASESSLLELMKQIPGAGFVTCFKPASRSEGSDTPRHYLAAPNETLRIGNLRVHTIPATGRNARGADAGGVAYLVEADGVKILHSGFHSSRDQAEQLERYRNEIDFLRPFGPIDIALLPVSGHVSVAYQPYLYLLDQLSPNAVYLMGGNVTTGEYPKCAEVLRARNVPVAYPEGGRAKGERFHYVRDQPDKRAASRAFVCDYLGKTPPGDDPGVFAQGLVSTGNHEHSAPTFSPDGNEVFWSMWPRPDTGEPQVIMTMRRENGVWSKPAVAPFSGRYVDGGPVFSPDGRRLYFYSTRPTPAGPTSDDIWLVERRAAGWSKPRCLEFVARFPEMKAVYQPSITRSGTLYLISQQKEAPPHEFLIWRAERVDGAYPRPELLPSSINAPGAFVSWTPFIAPDESFLLFSSGRRQGHGGGDLYVTHRFNDGTWSEPEILPDSVNTPQQDRFPAVSPDGKFLFFTSHTPGRPHDVYWVSTAAIPALHSTTRPSRESPR